MSTRVKKEYDLVIVGSGIAGLSFALKVAEAGYRVAIFTKKDKAESNTNYAQGGIAAVTSAQDDLDKHVEDTLEAGDGLCDPEIVREILRDGPARIQDLAEMGVSFSSLDDGRISLGKEGGHSKRRVLHVKDVTGKAIEDALLANIAKQGVTLFEHYFAIDLITARKARKLGVKVEGNDDRVLGIYFFDANRDRVVTVAAPVVLLATGGAGQTYLYTTNPSIATGDGVAMASRAGLSAMNLEFMQFHPTTLHSSDGDRFLVTEAVRGEGVKLIDAKGKPELEPVIDAAAEGVAAERLVSDIPGLESVSALSGLAAAVNNHRRAVDPSIGARTIEDLVKEVMSPMIREWLDDNLPALVERMVSREIERLTREAEEISQR